MEATSSNPNPIAVSKAEATAEAGVLKMFFELRGAGYPGSTYTLSYVPSTDQLRGIYFQAAARQSPPDMGWNAMRDQILANQKRLGVAPANTVLTEWPDDLQKWHTLSADEKKLYARQAEVFAAYAAYTG